MTSPPPADCPHPQPISLSVGGQASRKCQEIIRDIPTRALDMNRGCAKIGSHEVLTHLNIWNKFILVIKQKHGWLANCWLSPNSREY